MTPAEPVSALKQPLKARDVAIALVLVVILFGFMTNRSAPAPSRQVVAKVPIVVVGADELGAAYEANEVAADRTYKDKRLRIAGRVQTIGKDILDTPFITLGSGQVPKVQAMFTTADEPSLATLKTGESVTVECTGDGKLVWVIARKCVLR